MAWSAPFTAVSGNVLTAAQLNTNLRDNLNELMPAKATTDGYHFVSTGTNAIAERAIAGSEVTTYQSSASTTYVDLGTLGPQVTVTTGARALVFFSVNSRHSLADTAAYTSVAVSGATTIAASDNFCIVTDGVPALQALAISKSHYFSTLTSGVNTFSMQHRVNTGTGTWGDRHLAVMVL